MLPRNRLGRAQLRKLKVYSGPEHPHVAQQPRAAAVEEESTVAEGHLPRDRQAQDVRRPRDPDARKRRHHRQRPHARGLLRPRPTLRTPRAAPLALTGTREHFDVRARIHGGGISGQAGALRHGIAKALVEADPDLRARPEARGLPDARRARGRAQEGRPQEGPQAAAVLEAVIAAAATHIGCSEPTASAASRTRPS